MGLGRWSWTGGGGGLASAASSPPGRSAETLDSPPQAPQHQLKQNPWRECSIQIEKGLIVSNKDKDEKYIFE